MQKIYYFKICDSYEKFRENSPEDLQKLFKAADDKVSDEYITVTTNMLTTDNAVYAYCLNENMLKELHSSIFSYPMDTILKLDLSGIREYEYYSKEEILAQKKKKKMDFFKAILYSYLVCIPIGLIPFILTQFDFLVLVVTILIFGTIYLIPTIYDEWVKIYYPEHHRNVVETLEKVNNKLEETDTKLKEVNDSIAYTKMSPKEKAMYNAMKQKNNK